jgi:hypothetical protein
VGHREQLAEFDLRGLLGLACLAEPDLPAGERVGSGVYLGASGSVRQLLYVSAQGTSHDIDDPVHDLTRNSNEIAGGAGGARTHDRRIMSPLL